MNLTEEQIAVIENNTCIHCGNVTNENLRKWFKQKWVNIGKKKKGGGHPPCGTSGKKRGYAKCVPKSKASGMSKKQKTSATRRKRAAQNKANRGGTDSTRGGGKKPIRVKTKSENKMKYCQHDECAKVSEHIYEKKDACYTKVKSRYDVWPSAYASGALVKCRKVGAKNWGNKSKKEGVYEKNKGKTLYGKDLVNYFVKRFKYSTRDATAVANKLKDVGFKVPKVLPFNESVDENILKQIQQAEKIAKSMAGNMTGAVKGIEKIRRGLSRHKRVKVALKKANEGYPGISVKSLHDDEDVAEGKKQYGQKLTDNFFKSVRKFEQEVIVLGKMATKIRGDRTDEKIILKMYKKHMGPFIELIRSWNSTTQNNPHISEGKIQVQGIGMYDDKTLKKKILGMTKDLQKLAKNDEWSKSSENAIKALGRMWGAYQDWSRNNESVNEGIFGKFDTGAGFKGNGMTVYDRNQEKSGDFRDIVHIAPNGKITIYDKNVKKEPKLMQSLNKISQEFKKAFKESVNEGMDKRQAGETLKQLGGNKFIMMTGAKNFAVGPKGMGFKIGRNSKGVNYIRIDLDRGRDLYNMEFIQMRGGNLKIKSKVKGVYNDQLQKIFTKHTGMYTSLGTMGR